MTINPLSISRPSFEQPKRTAQELCDHWNAGMQRKAIAWIVGHDGKPHLEFVKTEFDREMALIKGGQMTQQEIDRLPFRVRRIAWNRGYLNHDYGDPPRYWVPGRRPDGFDTGGPARSGLSWYDDQEQ